MAIRPGLIDSYVYERVADAQLALGQTDSALDNYNLATQANRSLIPQLVLREKLADIFDGLGRPDDALAQYDAILAVAQNAPYRAQMEYGAAQVLLNNAQTDLGISRMQTVFNTYQGTSTAYLAMQSLLENNIPIDDFLRGKVSFDYGDYEDTIDAFNTYSTEHQLAAIPAELYLLLGRAYREIGNPSAAIVAFQTIIDQYPEDPLFGEALLEQGRTRFLEGDIEGAIQTYSGIAENYGYLEKTASDALWRVGYLYGTNGSPVLSRETFVRLADTYPTSEWATNGLFLAASAAVQEEQWTIAENLYSRLATISSGEDQAAAYLWVGRLALDRNDAQTANDAFGLAVSAAPDSYYAARASDILIGREPFDRPQDFQFTFDEGAQLVEAEAWLRQVFGITQEGSLWRLSPELETDSRMIRGQELWKLPLLTRRMRNLVMLLMIVAMREMFWLLINWQFIYVELVRTNNLSLRRRMLFGQRGWQL